MLTQNTTMRGVGGGGGAVDMREGEGGRSVHWRLESNEEGVVGL